MESLTLYTTAGDVQYDCISCNMQSVV